MEKKQKIIKTIICILMTLLIAGCFIVMAFMPKMLEQNSANADIVENPPTENNNDINSIISQNGQIWETPIQDTLFFMASKEQAYIRFDLSKYTGSGLQHSKNIKIKIEYSGYRGNIDFEIRVYDYYETLEQAGIYMKSGMYETFNTENLNYWDEIGAIRYVRIYLNDNALETQEPTTWLQIWRIQIEINNNEEGEEPSGDGITYTSYIYDIINSNKIPAYENGYNAGYQVGYDKGIISEWQSPIAIFIKPIDSFLSTNIFGSISIGDVLSVILFVMVGIIFIKMFAGG